MSHDPDFEIAIIGGGPAGLSAALVLGRARRATVLFDAGAPRNAPAAAAHGVFTRDGTPPLELRRIGREQLAPYPSVEVRDLRVDDVARGPDGRFGVHAGGRVTTANHLILATGVVDRLPPIPGLRDLWGTGVVHCPYCHGWEVRGQPFVLLAQQGHALHLARILRGWSDDVTVCPAGGFTLTEADREALVRDGLKVRGPVARLVGRADKTVADVVLESGEHLGPAAVFTSAPVEQRAPFAERLGCTVHAEPPFAGMVRTDPTGFTGVPGLYVAGDASEGFAQVVSAAAQGSLVGAMVNNGLLLEGHLPRGA